MKNVVLLPLCLVLLSSAIVGCGDAGVSLTQLNGKVLYRGKPLVGADVIFMPRETGGVSSGVTDSEGEFTLTYVDRRSGVLPGEHLLTITESNDHAGDEIVNETENVVLQKPVREYRKMMLVDASMEFVEIDVTGEFK
ncbi:carboxypeptidase-like regulatory domain-containing protein [Blastopirellula marina]|uniref:Lipoprotein n=1 Tax=Blastopirellula marina DSM 3645 TaxID=314230 RepID=A3ZU41_9BACT|nr:carboxypeptidase-like regulatory domain-containing protein [Blastopirellula marina]EAQ80106.1 hypothetical protein DSM3645_05770 [Blastopirellula marina DSM 3645]